MQPPIALALFAILALATSPAFAERACRPSLSNMYHCPDTSTPEAKPTKNTGTSDRACHPSISNLWTCPGTAKPSGTKSNSARACRPSLSNGYSCPSTASKDDHYAPKKKPVSTPDRGCRPSLSNGYKCPEQGNAGVAVANEYSTERQARSHCFNDTVVWANNKSNIYHFAGNYNYGNTVAGGYMCEQDAVAQGMRAAKNETHP